MRLRLLAVTVTLTLTLLLMPATALAQPVVPLLYHGNVTVGGTDAPAGTIISAEIEGEEIATSTTAEAGTYELDVGAHEGDVVILKVDGVEGGQTTHPDPKTAFEVVLDLSVPEPLTAEAGGPYSGTAGTAISLSGSASGGTAPYTYAWDLDNDGEYDDATGDSPSHTWATAGDYTISLEVTDDASATATDTATVEIKTTGPVYTYIPPPAPEIETNLFGTEAGFSIGDDGEILETIEATSEDGTLTITIPEGTKALDKDGDPLETLEAVVDESPPDPPEDAHIIGLAYNFGPDGATFDPPLTLTFTYDPDALPEGVSEEDLVIAFYDEETGAWVEFEGVVDTENHTITVLVSHFTTFAVIGTVVIPEEEVPEPLSPPSFQVSNLVVTPDEVEIGEDIEISVRVRNTGDLSGTYLLQLDINGEVVQTKQVALDGQGSITVPMIVSAEAAGVYNVIIDDLSGTFTVTSVVEPVLLSAAEFNVSNLSITPAEVETGETVNVSVLAANTGATEGTLTLILKVSGILVTTRDITLDGGDSQNVTFTHSEGIAGDYIVDVNGQQSEFTVKVAEEEESETNGVQWPLVGGIIGAAVVVAGLLAYMAISRRRATQ
ncbi:MAG TPA: PKD domain-containing protein [Dehalococcoidia bacterium]|nr:PKD domain-containing protein [Dehalococcoidia bacterium]